MADEAEIEDRNPLFFLESDDVEFEPNLEQHFSDENPEGEEGEPEGKKPEGEADEGKNKDGEGDEGEEAGKTPTGEETDQNDVTPDADGKVPHGALHAERERRKAKEAELAAINAELQALKNSPPPVKQPENNQQQEQEVKIPDPKEDPEGYHRFMEERAEFRALNQNLNLSERFARKNHGDEIVEAGLEWLKGVAQKSPALHREIVLSDDPYEKMIELKTSAELQQSAEGLNMSKDDVEAFRKWQEAQKSVKNGKNSEGGKTTAQSQSQQPKGDTPPASIVDDVADGGGKAPEGKVGGGTAFDNTFD